MNLQERREKERRRRLIGFQKRAIETGQVTVGGKLATPSTIVRNGEVISHTMHRHEPPVPGVPIGIIHEDDDLLVIDKPAGIPVHGAGRYHFNTIVEILKSGRPGFKPLPCNRLDRLTSGVMFLGKHPKAAEAMSIKLRERTVQKEYVARVKGRFPDGVVVCDQPIMSVSPKLGLNRVRATGKEAKTKFRRLAYYSPSDLAAASKRDTGDGDRPATPKPIVANEDEGYSIVHCLPLTGRTHQIRVHLQFLGHPISNDPIYSNRRVFGDDLGKFDTSADKDKEIMERLSKMGRTEVTLTPEETSTYRTHLTTVPNVPPGTDPSVIEEIMSREHEAAVEDYHKRKGERLSGEKCEVCNTPLYTDPAPHELGIFLHAIAYSDTDGNWKYRSKVPNWALPPEGIEGPTEVPEWKESPDEEVVINNGYVPGQNEPRKDGSGEDVLALVQGVGLVNLSKKIRHGDDVTEQLEGVQKATASNSA